MITTGPKFPAPEGCRRCVRRLSDRPRGRYHHRFIHENKATECAVKVNFYPVVCATVFQRLGIKMLIGKPFLPA